MSIEMRVGDVSPQSNEIPMRAGVPEGNFGDSFIGPKWENLPAGYNSDAVMHRSDQWRSGDSGISMIDWGGFQEDVLDATIAPAAAFDPMSRLYVDNTLATEKPGFVNSMLNAVGFGGTKSVDPRDAAYSSVYKQAEQEGLLTRVDAGYAPKDESAADIVDARVARLEDQLEQRYGERDFAAEMKKEDDGLRSFEKAQIWMMLGMVALQFYMRKDDRAYAEATYQKRREEAREDALWQRDVLYGTTSGGTSTAAGTSGGVRSGVQWL